MVAAGGGGGPAGGGWATVGAVETDPTFPVDVVVGGCWGGCKGGDTTAPGSLLKDF